MRRTGGAVPAILLVAVVSAGCLGLITGSEPAVFEASPASVGDAALSETDFQLSAERSPWSNRTVEAAGQERDVRVRNHVAVYELPAEVSISGGVTYGQFVVLSTPQASIAGQALNPVGRMSPRQLVTQVAGQAADFRDVQREGDRQRTILGSSAEVVRFSAVVERSGRQVPVTVEVTRVRHEGDFVVAFGAYPRDAEEVGNQVETLLGGLEH